MNTLYKAGIATVLAACFAAPTFADGGVQGRDKYPPKHNSNTFVKIGNALQYPVRKAGENLSVDTHRTTDHNSMVKNEAHGTTDIVRPNGNTYPVASDYNSPGWSRGARYMHRVRHNYDHGDRHYYWYQGHQYYQDENTSVRVLIQ